MNKTTDCYVYRGYHMLYNHMADIWLVSKGNAHIATAKTESDAKKIIDEIAEDAQ